MLKHLNLPTVDVPETRSTINSSKKLSKAKNELSTKEQEQLESDYRDNLDIFFTLLLKNFSSKERYLLLNKLLTMKWSNPNEDLDSQLAELKKSSESESKQSVDYEYFLWDFNNWKNFFLSENTK